MGLQDEVARAWRDALKARDVRKDALSLIVSELKKAAIDSRTDGSNATVVDDDTARTVLARMAKQRRESIAEYRKAGREDLATKEEAELSVLQEFLPAALGREALLAIVDEVIAATGAAGPSAMGKVMGPVMKKVAGRADGNEVRALVQERLAG